MITFVSTLLGAFFGVSAPFVIGYFIERRHFKRALDAAFVLSETYSQGVKVRADVIQRADGEARRRLFDTNTSSPATLRSHLTSTYSKFLRSKDVFLLEQAEQNLSTLFRNLSGMHSASPRDFNVAYNAFLEHAARRSWILYCIAVDSEEGFSLERYNQLVDSLNQSTERRITAVRMLASPTNEDKDAT